jgi:hypothetical protein
VSAALWASRTLDVKVDVVGQGGMIVWHDASLNEAGAQHSQSPECACEVRGDGNNFEFSKIRLLFNIDQVVKRNEALLNAVFQRLAEFSTN